MSDLPGTVVIHDPQRSRYEITLDGAPVGLAAYVDDGGRRVFHHTEVQQAYRGRGLAATLVREALTGPRAEGRRIVPLCPYVQRWVSEHGEDLDGAVEQAGPDVVSTVAARRQRERGGTPMSNVEAAREPVVCTGGTADVQLIEPRAVPLGGPRAMAVRRTLPRRARSLIGAWCFVDHYGPDDVSASGGMAVPGHPHTGLQTVSWLFEGEIEHRDTTGAHALVRPGELNLMTAGRGIAHSEFSTPRTSVLHGAQLWLALPERHRQTDPGFAHYVPPVTDLDGAQLRVFLGSLAGATSPVATFSPLLGAELVLPPGAAVTPAVDRTFEHGVLVDTGSVEVSGTAAESGELVYLPPGRTGLELRAGADGARLLLLGGEPLGERIVMWWNFVGSSHEEIAAYREQWQDERADGGGADGRFGPFPAAWESTLPAPELPNARLSPRE